MAAELGSVLTENHFNTNFLHTQNENNAAISDQTFQRDAVAALNNCSALTDIEENDHDGFKSCQTPLKGQSSPENSCYPQVVMLPPKGNPQMNGQDDNPTAGARSDGKSHLNGQHSPSASCHPTYGQPSPDDNLGAEAVSSSIQNNGDSETMFRNLDHDADQTKEKLMVNFGKRNGCKPRPPAAPRVPNHHAPNHENRENNRPPGMNDINIPSRNIPVAPGNQAENKLVVHCCEETLEYLTDGLLTMYSRNWRHIASHHGWHHQKICHFEHKYSHSAFKKLLLETEFGVYTVQDLLNDLKRIKRKDLLADYPTKWG